MLPLSKGHPEAAAALKRDPIAAETVNGYFKPLHMLLEWVVPKTTTIYLTVIVLFSTGMDAGDFTVLVVYDGSELYVSVK